MTNRVVISERTVVNRGAMSHIVSPPVRCTTYELQTGKALVLFCDERLQAPRIVVPFHVNILH